jgi:hypothetical protein
MIEKVFIITECNIIDENLIEFKPSLTLISIRELKDFISNKFPGQKTYQTKESDSNESLIKSTTDETKFLHVLEI